MTPVDDDGRSTPESPEEEARTPHPPEPDDDSLAQLGGRLLSAADNVRRVHEALDEGHPERTRLLAVERGICEEHRGLTLEAALRAAAWANPDIDADAILADKPSESMILTVLRLSGAEAPAWWARDQRDRTRIAGRLAELRAELPAAVARPPASTTSVPPVYPDRVLQPHALAVLCEVGEGRGLRPVDILKAIAGAGRLNYTDEQFNRKTKNGKNRKASSELSFVLTQLRELALVEHAAEHYHWQATPLGRRYNALQPDASKVIDLAIVDQARRDLGMPPRGERPQGEEKSENGEGP